MENVYHLLFILLSRNIQQTILFLLNGYILTGVLHKNPMILESDEVSKTIG
jgi:hypothetical protein